MPVLKNNQRIKQRLAVRRRPALAIAEAGSRARNNGRFLTHTPNCRRGARLWKGCGSALARARTIRSIVPAERVGVRMQASYFEQDQLFGIEDALVPMRLDNSTGRAFVVEGVS